MFLIKKLAICIVPLLLAIIVFSVSILEAAEIERRVVLLAVDRLSFNNLLTKGSQFEHIDYFLEYGALGLMNTRTGGATNTENAYATLGAGTRALGGRSASLGFNLLEKYQQELVRDIHYRRYGSFLEGEEIVVFLGLPEIIARNKAKNHKVVPGALGEKLFRAGKRVVILGNSDINLPRRFAPLMLTNFAGKAGKGVVSSDILIKDTQFPFGHRLNNEKLVPLFQEYFKKNHVVLIEWGDFYRLDEYSSNLTPARQKELLKSNFEYLNDFLGEIAVSLNTDDTLFILFSPSPPRHDRGTGRMLTPVVIYQGEKTERGLLTSATTRRGGIITNLDIAPAILDFLGLEKSYYFLGESIFSQPFQGAGDFLQKKLLEIDRIYLERTTMIQVFIFLQIFTVTAALFAILIKSKKTIILQLLILSLLLMPLFFLLLSFSPPWSLALTIGVTFGTALIFGYLLFFLFEFKKNIILITSLTSASLVLDLTMNKSQLLQVSFLGYDPVVGARYYGLGNELMGVLIGSTLIAILVSVQFYPRVKRYLGSVFVAYYLFIVFLLASPSFGANFGGILTGLAAGFIALKKIFFQQRRKNIMFYLISGGVFLFIFFIWLNLPLEGREISHLGRSMIAIREGGIQELYYLVVRKASMNLRLLRHSLWSRVFLSLLFVQAILLFRPLGLLKQLEKEYPLLMGGLLGITAGSVVAFLTNDSGVVAAATLLLYSTLPLLYFLLHKIMSESQNTKKTK